MSEIEAAVFGRFLQKSAPTRRLISPPLRMSNVPIQQSSNDERSKICWFALLSLQTVRPRRYSQNLNCSVLCPLPPNFGLSRVYDSITLTDKTPKTGKISTKMCRSIHHTGLPINLDGFKISATSSVA